MRKRARNLVRTRGKRVLNSYNRMVCHFAYAQLSEKWDEWKFRTISYRQASLLVSAGEASAITREIDGVVCIVGYRALKPTSWERPSAATLTVATTHAVANAVTREEKSHRLTRRERDEIFKYKVYALIGDDKAVSVRPRITEAERAEAEKLLGPVVVRVPSRIARVQGRQRLAQAA